MLALCIFQTFHLWCANLIYAAFIVLFLSVPGFSVYKVCVYGNALALATSASVVLVVERDIPFSIKEYYWVWAFFVFSYLIKVESLKYTTGFCSSQSRMDLIV